MGARSGGGGGSRGMGGTRITVDRKTGMSTVHFNGGKLDFSAASKGARDAFAKEMRLSGNFATAMKAAQTAEGTFGGVSHNTYAGASTSMKGWTKAQKQAYKSFTNPKGGYKYPHNYAAKAVNANADWING